jgi:hypothetical protein
MTPLPYPSHFSSTDPVSTLAASWCDCDAVTQLGQSIAGQKKDEELVHISLRRGLFGQTNGRLQARAILPKFRGEAEEERSVNDSFGTCAGANECRCAAPHSQTRNTHSHSFCWILNLASILTELRKQVKDDI